MSGWKPWTEALSALPRGEPDDRHDHNDRVNRQRPKPPRVRVAHDGDREPDRSDYRDQEDRPDREHDEEDVE